MLRQNYLAANVPIFPIELHNDPFSVLLLNSANKLTLRKDYLMQIKKLFSLSPNSYKLWFIGRQKF